MLLDATYVKAHEGAHVVSKAIVIATGISATREREILDLVARGRTNREIAEILTVSTRTVDTHVSRLLTKLGASRRTEAADVARRHGLFE